MNCLKKILVPILFISFSKFGYTQLTVTRLPASWGQFEEIESLEEIPAIKPKLPDVEKAIIEDLQSDQDRFALPVDLNAISAKNGKWEVSKSGFKIWRIKISDKNSKGWILCFNELKLPEGSSLYIYSADKKILKGAFTAINNSDIGKLTVGPIAGPDVIIEFNTFEKSGESIPFKIEKLYSVYKSNLNVPGTENSVLGDPAYNSSLPCMININCPEGSSYGKQKDGIVRILLAGDKGFYYCTGTLINNTKQDSTPYILSAFHCEHDFIPNYDNYIFAFGWETPGCQLPVIEPTFKTLDGCSMMARRQESDFVLYKLKSKLPVTYGAYFNGWNKSDTKSPQSTAMIHHPNGDVKKISIDQAPAVVWNSPINWMNGIITPAKNHWRVGLDKGASMGGSSGAPLFDEKKLVVGQLNGGNSNCMLSTLFYGRLSKSWADGPAPDSRLKEWLDPLDLGLDTLSGLEVAASPVTVISGRITNSKSIPIKNVVVVLSGFVNSTFKTGSDGRYKFENLPAGQSYTITPTYDTTPLDGVSTGDISVINKHVLGKQTITSEFKKLSADVNRSNTISTSDINTINKMVLGKQYEFPNNKNWYFVTPNYKWPLLSGNADAINFQNIQIDQFDVDFIGVKLGDVTGTN